jgi:hypothetical protein
VGVARAAFKSASVDKFGWVLIACLSTYVFLVALDSSQWSGLAGSLPVLFTVVFTINATLPGPVIRRFALGTIVLAVVLGGVNAAHHNPDVFGITMLLTSLSLLACIVAILARMAEHTTVSVHTVLAVLAAYVMIGLFFTFLESGIGHIAGTFFAQPNAHTQSDYAYLSFVTLTTTGFGDYTPGTGTARSVIILEALIGQIFLVTLVARMVSLYGTERAPMSIRRKVGPSEDPE